MPTNTYTNYAGVKTQNHILAIFRRNATGPGDSHLTPMQRAERMLETLHRLPYGSKREGWGYQNCRHAYRVLRRYIRVFGSPNPA